MMRSIANGFCAGLLCVVAACTPDVAGQARVQRMDRFPTAINDHGFDAGAAIAPLTLACTDSRERVIGAPKESAPQLITFTTPGDCSACEAHLSGLKAMHDENRLAVEHLFVSYPVGMPRGVAERQYAAITAQPVCWDDKGAFWDNMKLIRTPVTALLVDGQVALLHDAPLTVERARREFAEDVASALKARGKGRR